MTNENATSLKKAMMQTEEVIKTSVSEGFKGRRSFKVPKGQDQGAIAESACNNVVEKAHQASYAVRQNSLAKPTSKMRQCVWSPMARG